MKPLSLLLYAVLVASAHSQSSTTAFNGRGLLTNSTWLNGILALARGLPSQDNVQRDISQSLNGLLGQLPGLLQGLGGVNTQENDVGQLLAGLFSDSRAAGTPAWIEALVTQGSSLPQSLQDAQRLLQSFSQQDPSDQVQALLARVFTNITQGLQSLGVMADSSPQDIFGSILDDTGLMSSLSSGALQLIGTMGGSEVLQQLLQQQFPVDPNSQCGADLSALGTALQQGDMWALQMLDATGKLQAGLLTGMTTLLGDYDECLAISHVNGSRTIQGQFCSVSLALPEFLMGQASGLKITTYPHIELHLCLPRSCATLEQVSFLLQPTVGALGSQFLSANFFPEEDPTDDSVFIATVVTLGVLALLCSAGTTYSAILDRKKEKTQAPPIIATIHGHTNNVYTNHEDGHKNGAQTDDNTMATNGQTDDNTMATNGQTDDNTMATNGQTDDNTIATNGQTDDNTMATNGLTIGNTMATNGLTNGNTLLTNRLTNGNKDIRSLYAELENGKNDTEGETTQDGNATADVKQSASEETFPLPERKTRAPGLPSQLLLSFSVLRNGGKVLNCDKNSADISCLHGIRVLSITWVVLGHCFSLSGGAQTNPAGVFDMTSTFTYTAIVSGVLAVDTFFLLSGFLSAFLFLRTTKKAGHLNVSSVVLYYVHRIWRLTPLYGLVLLVYIGVVPYIVDGPFSYEQLLGVPVCRDYWYLNLLYVHNFFDISKQCLGWSWYLSNDMQFSFLAPLVLIPWYFGGRVKIIGFLLAAGMILTHCITTAVLMVTRDLSFLQSNQLEYAEDVYFKPWCRIGPYAVGLILGYILHAIRGKYTMTKMSAFLGWTMATAVGLTLVYIPYDNVSKVMTEGFQWDIADNAAYDSVSRVLWAVCVSWVIFACTTGYGGFVNTLMSWSAWIPLSRLTYGVYLIHLVIIQVLLGNLKKPIYLDGWIVIQLNLAVTVLSFLLSFLFSMLVEAPTLGLEKAVLGKIFGKRK